MNFCEVEGLRGVDVSHTGNGPLIKQRHLDGTPSVTESIPELLPRNGQGVWSDLLWPQLGAPGVGIEKPYSPEAANITKDHRVFNRNKLASLLTVRHSDTQDEAGMAGELRRVERDATGHAGLNDKSVVVVKT